MSNASNPFAPISPVPDDDLPPTPQSPMPQPSAAQSPAAGEPQPEVPAQPETTAQPEVPAQPETIAPPATQPITPFEALTQPEAVTQPGMPPATQPAATTQPATQPAAQPGMSLGGGFLGKKPQVLAKALESDSDLVKALRAIIPTLKRYYQNQVLEVARQNLQLKFWWWMMMLIYSVVAGLSISVLASRSADIFSFGIYRNLMYFLSAGNAGSYALLSVGPWLLCFLIFSILFFIAAVIRAAMLKATAASTKATLSFTECANVVATGLVLPTATLVLIFVIELLPIPFLTQLLVSLLLLVLFTAVFLGELLCYNALSFHEQPQKSPLLSFAFFWGLYLGIVGILLSFGLVVFTAGFAATAAIGLGRGLGELSQYGSMLGGL